MPYYEQRVQAGRVLEIYRYHSLRRIGMKIPRGKNRNKTTQPQQLRNWINSAKRLTWMVNANFGPGDLYITLTYSGQPPTQAQAAKELAKFIRRVRAYRRKEGLPDLKYITVTESRGSRLHHHLVMNAMSGDEARKIWQYEPDPKKRGSLRPIQGHGRAPTDTLDQSGDYTFLARYLGKENKPGHKRWSGSTNLKPPTISKPKEISRRTLTKTPQAPKGYLLKSWERRADSGGHETLAMRCTEIKKREGE